ALLIVRGLPALLYSPLIGRHKALVAGLLQATSLPFIVAATQIGVQIGVVTQASAAALIAAGVFSVFIVPAGGLPPLGRAVPAPRGPRGGRRAPEAPEGGVAGKRGGAPQALRSGRGEAPAGQASPRREERPRHNR